MSGYLVEHVHYKLDFAILKSHGINSAVVVRIAENGVLQS